MSRKARGRNEGSIFQRTDRRWCAILSLGFDGSGKRRRRSVYGATKQEVADKLRALQTDAASGTLVDSAKLSVGDYLQRWLENTAKNKVRATTWQGYDRCVRLYLVPILGRLQLAKLRAVHVEGLYAQMERAGSTAWTRRSAAVVLTIALRHAVRLKLIPHSPAGDVPKPRPAEREMHFLTEPQVKQFLEATQGVRLAALFAIAVGSGARQGELLGLRWADVDFAKGTISIARSLAQVKGEFILKEPKSRTSRRTVALPTFALDALRSHRAAMLKEGNIGAPVFCTREGTHIAKTNLIRQVFKPILARANQLAPLPAIRFHDLRHSHASNLLARGHSIKAISQRLGHAGIDITLRTYAHCLPADDAKLAQGLNSMYG